jgi:hypothetical protein
LYLLYLDRAGPYKTGSFLICTAAKPYLTCITYTSNYTLFILVALCDLPRSSWLTTTCELFAMSVVGRLLSAGTSGSRTGGHTMFINSSIHHTIQCPEGDEYLYSVDTHPPHFRIFPNPPFNIHHQSSVICPFLGHLMHTLKGSRNKVVFSVVDEVQMYSQSLRNSLSNPSIVCPAQKEMHLS